MRAALLHLRTSPSRWLVVPLAAVQLAVLLVRDGSWQGIWPQTGAAVTTSTYLASLLVSGASAWLSSQASATGVRQQAAAAAVHREAAVELRRFAAHVVWVLASMVVPVAVAAGLTLRAAHGPPPGVAFFGSYLVMALTLALLACAWGWLAGRVLPRIAASSVAAVIWFVGVQLLDGVAVESTGPGVGLAPLGAGSDILLSPVALWSRLAAVALAAVLVAALPAVLRNRPRTATVHLGCAGMALAVLLAVVATLQLGVQRPLPAHPPCERFATTIEYCLWPEDEVRFPLVRTADERLAALPVQLSLPARVVDYGMSGGAVWRDGIIYEQQGDFPPEVLFRGTNPWAVADSLARAVTAEAFRGCPIVSDTGPDRREQLQYWLEARLAGGGAPDYVEDAPQDVADAGALGRRATQLDEAAQGAWARQLVDGLRADHCGG